MKSKKAKILCRIALAVCIVVVLTVSAAVLARYVFHWSPYKIPELHRYHTTIPGWDDSRGEIPADTLTRYNNTMCYPHQKSVDERIEWLSNIHGWTYLPEFMFHQEEFYAEEENLRALAWVEAEMDYLGFTKYVDVMEKLGLDRNDYLVYKWEFWK